MQVIKSKMLNIYKLLRADWKDNCNNILFILRGANGGDYGELLIFIGRQCSLRSIAIKKLDFCKGVFNFRPPLHLMESIITSQSYTAHVICAILYCVIYNSG